MLTPMDIHAKEFGRSFRGFNENEVNDFLNEIMKAYTAVLDENERLRGELERERSESSAASSRACARRSSSRRKRQRR